MRGLVDRWREPEDRLTRLECVLFFLVFGLVILSAVIG